MSLNPQSTRGATARAYTVRAAAVLDDPRVAVKVLEGDRARHRVAAVPRQQLPHGTDGDLQIPDQVGDLVAPLAGSGRSPERPAPACSSCTAPPCRSCRWRRRSGGRDGDDAAAKGGAASRSRSRGSSSARAGWCRTRSRGAFARVDALRDALGNLRDAPAARLQLVELEEELRALSGAPARVYASSIARKKASCGRCRRHVGKTSSHSPSSAESSVGSGGDAAMSSSIMPSISFMRSNRVRRRWLKDGGGRGRGEHRSSGSLSAAFTAALMSPSSTGSARPASARNARGDGGEHRDAWRVAMRPESPHSSHNSHNRQAI